jgi:chromosomal replication initiation ATPase DnaA
MAPARMSQDELVALHAEACALVSAAFKVSRRALMQSRARKGKATFARQVAMYLIKMQDVSLEKVGAMFGGRHLTTVKYALAAVEDARDDPALDAKLDALEITLYRRLKGRTENGLEVQDRADAL